MLTMLPCITVDTLLLACSSISSITSLEQWRHATAANEIGILTLTSNS